MAELNETATVAAMRLIGKPLKAAKKYEETEFRAREKMQEYKLNEEGVHDKAKQRAAADWETAADRGIAARKNIYGAVGSVRKAIKTYPTEIVQEARAARHHGGARTAEKLVGEGTCSSTYYEDW